MMKTIPQPLVLCLLFASPLASRAALEFYGYMSASGDVRFAIGDTETGLRSPWLANGQMFLGHRIVGFEKETDTLILVRGSQTIRLPLKAAQTIDGGSRPTPRTVRVAIGSQRFIAVRNDSIMFDALRAELQSAAAITPQPVITILAHSKTEASLVESIFEVLMEAGLKKISIAPVSNE